MGRMSMTMAQTKTSQGPRAEPVGRRVRLSVWCALPRTLGCSSNVSTFYFAHYTALCLFMDSLGGQWSLSGVKYYLHKVPWGLGK